MHDFFCLVILLNFKHEAKNVLNFRHSKFNEKKQIKF